VIARIWRGATKADRADDYLEYLDRTGVSEYRATPGNRGVMVLRLTEEDRTEFTLVSLWDSMDAVRAFARPDSSLQGNLDPASVGPDNPGMAVQEPLGHPTEESLLQRTAPAPFPGYQIAPQAASGGKAKVAVVPDDLGPPSPFPELAR
jgi:heme-degrading monooxygenase HmoA